MPRQYVGWSQRILIGVHVGVLRATYAAGYPRTPIVVASTPCRSMLTCAHCCIRVTSSLFAFRRPPGTKFTYDSDTFIAYLSYLLDQVAGAAHNSSARQFADEFFAGPLGVPDLYAFQDGDPQNIGDKPYEKYRYFVE